MQLHGRKMPRMMVEWWEYPSPAECPTHTPSSITSPQCCRACAVLGVTSGKGTSLGHVGLPSSCLGDGVLPTSHPLGYLCWDLGRCWEHLASHSRKGWNPSEDPHSYPHPLDTPCPTSPPALPWQQSHLLLPAALHPGSVIQHGGRWRGGVGYGPSRAPLSLCVPTVVPGQGDPPALSWRVSGRLWAALSLAPHADAPLLLRYLI